MKIIAHRGNLSGPIPEKENHPDYISDALIRGYDVEVDVWYQEGVWALGHDDPQYEVDVEFLKNESFWCHAKNIEALYYMLSRDIHCFWHQEDSYTLTSLGYIWTYPNQILTSRSICVMPERYAERPVGLRNLAGICTDFVAEYSR